MPQRSTSTECEKKVTITFSDAVSIPLVQEWLDGHRLGLAATLCLVGDPSLRTAGVLDSAEDRIAQFLEGIPKSYDCAKSVALLSLPLFSLRQMHELSRMTDAAKRPPQKIASRAGCIESAIERLTILGSERPEAVCPVRVIELAETLVYHSNWGAEQLVRLFTSSADRVFTVAAKLWKGRDHEFSDTLLLLRSSWLGGASALNRLTAAVSLSQRLMGSMSERWWMKRFTFRLLDRLFAWPLLVITNNEGSSLSVSVPLAVELEVSDGRPFIQDVCGSSVSSQVSSQWKRSYGHVLQSALALYYNAQATRGTAQVDRIGVKLDFRFVEELIRPLLSGIPLDLEDRSMEAYLVSVILSRMLGQPVSPSTLITGQISEGDSKNAKLEWPGGVPLKLDYAFASATADRILVPAGHTYEVGEYLAVARNRQTASIYQVDTLQKAVQAAIGPLASAYRFIRCPEIALADGMPPSDRILLDDYLSAVNSVIKSSDSVFVDIADHTATLDVTASEVHEALKKRRGNGERLSWLFIRLFEDEDDDALWELLGESLGASGAEIDFLIRAGAPTRLATQLSGLLDTAPVRSTQQFIVIVGGSERRLAYDQAPDRSIYTHGLKPVLEELDRIVKSAGASPAPYRIILAPNRLRDISATGPTAIAEPDWLDRLRVFRGGFDQSCAALILEDLNWRGGELREQLELSVSQGWLRKLPDGDFLVAEGRGQPTKIKAPQTLAALHQAAASAMAPWFSPNQKRVGLSLDEARRVATVLEVSHHLREAIRHDSVWSAAPEVEKQEKQPRGQKYIFVQRFLRRRSLSSLRCPVLLDYAPEVVMNWIEEDEQRLQAEGLRLHPLIYAWDGRYVLAALKRNSSLTWEHIPQTAQRLFGFFERALEYCSAPELCASRDYLMCTVVSRLDSLAALLLKDKSLRQIVIPLSIIDTEREEYKGRLKVEVQRLLKRFQLDSLNRQVIELLLKDSELRLASAVLGEWCERIACDESDPVIATEISARGVMGNPKWVTCWPWFFGALKQAVEVVLTEADRSRLHSLEKTALLMLSEDENLLTRVRSQKAHTDPVVVHYNAFSSLRAYDPSVRYRLGISNIEKNLTKKNINKRLADMKKFQQLEPLGRLNSALGP